MPKMLTTFDPTLATSGRLNNPLGKNYGTVVFWNESDRYLKFTDEEGNEYFLPPWIADRIPICQPSPSLTWNVLAALSGSGPAPQASVYGLAYQRSEQVASVYPLALSRQSTVGGTVTAVNTFSFPSGTVMPASPADNDIFLRTDQNILYKYNQTDVRWYSMQEYLLIWSRMLAVQPLAATGGLLSGVLPSGATAYLTQGYISTLINSPADGTNYWQTKLVLETDAIVDTTLATQTNQTTNAGWQRTAYDLLHLCALGEQHVQLAATKVGAPGSLFAEAVVKYRLVQ